MSGQGAESSADLLFQAPRWSAYLWVALGGALGACARFALATFALSRAGAVLWGTLAANLLGCLALGWVAAWAERSGLGAHAPARLFWAVGVLGAFTTFSTFSLEAWDLARRDSYGTSALYLGASVGLGLAAVWLGRAWGLRGA